MKSLPCENITIESDGSIRVCGNCATCLRTELAKVKATLEQAREAFHFIAQGHIVPGYKGEHEHPLIALAQEVIHGAQTKAREALAALNAGKEA